MQMRTTIGPPSLVLGLLLGCAPTMRAAGDVVTWTGDGDGTSWNDVDNWDAPSLPGVGDDVVIGAGANVELGSNEQVGTLQCPGALTIDQNGSLDLAGPSSARDLSVAGGDLSGAGDLSVTEFMGWTGGTLTGPGELQIAMAASCNINVITPTTLARNLSNIGTLTIGGSVSFDSAPGETTEIVNLRGGQIQVSDAAVAVVAGASGRITNLGVMDVTDLEIAHPLEFNNDAGIEVQDVLGLFTSNGTHSGTIILTAAGTDLLVAGDGYQFADGAVVGGAGLLCISKTLVTSGTVTLNCRTEVSGLFDPVVDVAGELIIAGMFKWVDGTLSGAGSITIPMGSTTEFALGANARLRCRIDNHGTISWSNGQLFIGDAAHPSGITNHPNGVIDIMDGTDVVDAGEDEAFIDNQGAITKTGAPPTSIGAGIRFDNDNQVELDGELIIRTNDGETSGAFLLGDDGILEIASAIGYTFAGDEAIAGTGLVRITGELSASGDVGISGGTVELSGTVSGAGDVTFDTFVNWTAGTMAGPGSVIVVDGAVLDLAGGSLTLTTTLDNHGDAFFVGGTILLTGGTFHNHSDGTVTSLGTVQINGDSAGAFLNDGTILQEEPVTFTVGIFPTFDSPGTIYVTDGTLLVRAITGTTTGSIMIEQPGVVRFEANTGASTYVIGDGAQATGGGTLVISGRVFAEGTVVIDSPAHLIGVGILDGSGTVVFNGTLLWTTGEMSGTGTTVIGATGVATMTSGNRTLARQLDVLGTVNWTGGQLLAPAAGEIDILPGGRFKCEGGTSMPFFGASLTNLGLFSMNAPMQTQINASFVNGPSGTIEVLDGTLFLAGAFPNFDGGALTSGIYLIDDTFKFNFADIDVLDATVRLNGPGIIIDHGGVDALDGLQTVDLGGLLGAGPGASIGVGDPFDVQGGLDLGGVVTGGDAGLSGLVEVEVLGGDQPGVSAGSLVMTGTLTLGGGLAVSVPVGPDPPVGTSIDVMTADAIEGSFDCFDLPALADGIMQVTTGSDRVTVSIVPGCSTPGDVDRDGVVGFSDLIVVLAQWGACPSTCCIADIDENGTVEFADLVDVLAGWGPCMP